MMKRMLGLLGWLGIVLVFAAVAIRFLKPEWQPYYNGLRLTISARGPDGEAKPFIDGGTFDWVATLTANRKQLYIASALGTQAVAAVFRHTR